MSEYEYKILKRKEIDLDKTIQKYSKLGFIDGIEYSFRLMSQIEGYL